MNMRYQEQGAFSMSFLLATVVALFFLGYIFYSGVRKTPSPMITAPQVAPPLKATNNPRPFKTNQSAQLRKQLDSAVGGLTNDPVKRQAQVEKSADEISIEEIPAALESLWSEKSTSGQWEFARALLRRWAEADPAMASRWVDAKPAGAHQQEGALLIATGWANQDPDAAADWVKNWPEEQRSAGTLAVGFEAARKSPKEALNLAASLEAGESRDRLTLFALKQWSSMNSPEAIQWAEQLEQSPLRNQAFADIAVQLSEKDPVAAGRLALEKIEPGEQQGSAIVSIVQQWAQSAPGQAAEWVAKFPPGELQNAALDNLVQLWSDSAPAQTAEWLNGLSEGNYRDQAIAAFAGKVASTEPEAAMRWVQSIGDSRTKQIETDRVLERWKEIDPTKAADWERGNKPK